VTTPGGPTEQHRARFDQTVAWFTFNFSFTKPVNIVQIANNLLRSGLAETASTPTSDEVRVSPRYLKLARLVRSSGRLGRASDQLADPALKKWAFALRNPTLYTGAYGRALWSVIRRRNINDDGKASEERALGEEMASVVQGIKRAVAVAQYKNAVFHAIEKDLYRPSFLQGNAYLRLDLRPTLNWHRTKDDGTVRSADDFDEGVLTEAQLLVHRSGVMQLTIMVRLPANLASDGLIEHAHGGSPVIVAAEYPEVLLRLASQAGKARETAWLGHWSSELREGQRWRRMNFEAPASITDLFNMYLDAIAAATKTPLNSGWLCYPTLFVDRTSCCAAREDWQHNHSKELSQVVSRIANDRLRAEKIEALTPSDSSLVDDDSVYMTVGMATVINWRLDRTPNFGQCLQRYIIIESCLLRYWQLVVLHTRLGETLHKRRPDIRRIQVETIGGMQEWSQSAITYGSATEVADDLLNELGVGRLHSGLIESLSQLQQMQEAQDSRQAATRSTVLAMVAVLATVLLGLPAVSAAVDVAHGTNEHSFIGKLAAPLRSAGHHGASGTWTLFLALVALVALIFAITLWFPRPSHIRVNRGSRRMPGLRWPWGTIKIERVPPNTEVDASETPLP
jgi:hypothetical protein